MDLQDTMKAAGEAFGVGDLEKALNLFDDAAGMSQVPKVLCIILTNKAATLQRLGRNEEAIDVLTEALSHDPEYVPALFNKGVVLRGLSKFEDASAVFDSVLSIQEKNYQALCGKAETLCSLGKFEEALGFADRAIAVDPKGALGHVDRAFCFLKLKKFQDAINSYDRSGSETEETKRLLAVVLTFRGGELDAEGKHEEALAYFQRAVKNQETEARQFSIGVMLYKLERKEEAKVQLEKVLKKNPNHLKACAALGSLNCEASEFGKAAVLLEKVYKGNEFELLEKSAILQNLGVAYVKIGKIAEGRKMFEELLELEPGNKIAKDALKAFDEEIVKEAEKKRETVEKVPPAEAPSTAAEEAAVAALSAKSSLSSPPPPPPEKAKKEPKVEKAKQSAAPKSKTADSPAKSAKAEEHESSPKSQGTNVFFPLSKLQAPGPYPEGIDVTKREVHIKDAEFETIFNMKRGAFGALPMWKQQSLKKKVGLF